MHRIDDRFPSTEADPWNRLMREVKYEIESDEMAGSYYVYILGSIKGTMMSRWERYLYKDGLTE